MRYNDNNDISCFFWVYFLQTSLFPSLFLRKKYVMKKEPNEACGHYWAYHSLFYFKILDFS